MTAPLRPMNLGEILDRTFQIYRSRFLVFAGIAALPALAMIGINFIVYLLEELGPQPTIPFGFRTAFHETGLWLTSVNFESYLYCLIAPALTYAASRFFMEEESTIEAAVLWCIARWRSCLAMAAVLWVALYLLPAVLTDPPFVRRASYSAAVTLMGSERAQFLQLGAMFLFIVRWVAEALLGVALSPSVPAWTLEDLPVNSALRRGWTLARGSRLRIFAAWFLAAALKLILYLIFLIVFGLILWIVVRISNRPDLYERSYRYLDSLPVQAASILVAPLFPIAITLFYYDQRIRLEGYDIERMMDAAGMNAPELSPTEDSPIASAAPEEVQQ